IGLPTEQDDDVVGIADLGKRCVDIGLRYHRSVTVTASVGGFVPKPHTPFQWFGQATVAELHRNVAVLRDAARGTRGLTIRWHDPEATAAEGIASRGDRRVGAVIERVWRDGGTFQEWTEHFDLARWEKALAAEGLSLDEVVYRHRHPDEALPWDHISAGLHRDFLWEDWQQALPAPASRTAGGPPATTAAPAPGSAWSTSSPPRSPRPAAARALARTWPAATASPSTSSPPARPAPRERQPAVPVHQAREDPVHQPTGRGPDVGTGVPPDRVAGGVVRGVLPTAVAQLRTGPTD